jgi:hypothetical protein
MTAAKAEAQRGAISNNPDAIDLMMRGWAALWQQPTKKSAVLGLDYFECAIKIDPQNPEASAGGLSNAQAACSGPLEAIRRPRSPRCVLPPFRYYPSD